MIVHTFALNAHEEGRHKKGNETWFTQTQDWPAGGTLCCHVMSLQTQNRHHKIHQDQLLTVDLVHKQNTKSNCKYDSHYHPAFVVTIICLLIFALTMQKLSVNLYLTFLPSKLFSSTQAKAPAASSYVCTAPCGQMMPLLQWEHLYRAETDRNLMENAFHFNNASRQNRFSQGDMLSS